MKTTEVYSYISFDGKPYVYVVLSERFLSKKETKVIIMNSEGFVIDILDCNVNNDDDYFL